MAFRGLFIGIDRYMSADIGELSCAARDAVALDALFADNLGGNTVLLTDEKATFHTIREQFDLLSTTSEEDTVVIGFSGHGSETHELVAYDTDYYNLAETAIPLGVLQEWFSRIPAKRLVLFLDCCFAGGLGSKVLQVPARPRNPASTEVSLAKLAGEGRLIFTASGATEEAWEQTRQGHGLLTYYVLEALRGPTELLENGRLSIYRLFDFVSARVKAAAHQIGKVQNPATRGLIDGGLSWTPFKPGARFLKAFPDLAPAGVTPDLSSLAAVGFPPELITAWGSAIPSLNALQVDAINEFGLLEGKHLVVSAPTSSGKTMVGELAALKHVLQRKRAIFLLPLKALVADKKRHFDAVYGHFGVRTVEATGETDDISPLILGKYDIALLTYEKFAALALGQPHVVNQAGIVVIDEAQMIADQSRGANLEFVLTLLKMRRQEGIEPQLVALSAVIGDTGGLETWIDGRLLRREQRPVPLREGVLRSDGSFRYIDPTDGKEYVEKDVVQRQYGKGSSQDWIIPLVRKLTAGGQQVIVFRETKSESRNVGNYLAANLDLPPAKDAVARMPALDASQAHRELVSDLGRGVAFHNADLQPLERRIVEEEFRKPGSGLRIISATTTLAMGINTPASTVIIAGLQHPGGVPYSVAEYKNLVGRAGRLGYAEEGTSYLLALDAREESHLWHTYVTGKPEDLTSRFLDDRTDPRSLIVRVIVALARAGDGASGDQIVSFLEASFGAFIAARQRDGWRWSRTDLFNALADLERHGLVSAGADGLYKLTPLGRVSGESATEVDSVVRLVAALSGLPIEDLTDPALLTAVQNTVELDDVLIPMNKTSKHREPQTWFGHLRQQAISPRIVRSIENRPAEEMSPTARAKKAVACLFYIGGTAMSDIERAISQHGGGFGGSAGPIRSVAARTSDLLPVAARIAEILNPGLDLSSRVARLTIRLTYGVPSAAVDIAREAGNALQRGDYCSLAELKLASIDALDAASDDVLLRAIGNDREKVAALRNAAGASRARSEDEARRESVKLPAYEC